MLDPARLKVCRSSQNRCGLLPCFRLVNGRDWPRYVREFAGPLNIKKHRNDVARLLQILSPEVGYALPDTVANDMRSFVELATAEADYDPKQFKVNMTREDVADRLRAAYEL